MRSIRVITKIIVILLAPIITFFGVALIIKSILYDGIGPDDGVFMEAFVWAILCAGIVSLVICSYYLFKLLFWICHSSNDEVSIVESTQGDRESRS